MPLNTLSDANDYLQQQLSAYAARLEDILDSFGRVDEDAVACVCRDPGCTDGGGNRNSGRARPRRKLARVPKALTLLQQSNETGQLVLPRQKRNYKFQNVAGGYAYNEQLNPNEVPLPPPALYYPGQTRERIHWGVLLDDEVTELEQGQLREGLIFTRKMTAVAIGTPEWMNLARLHCEQHGIDKLGDERIHDLQEPLKAYVVFLLKNNLEPSIDKGDDCKKSSKLTKEQFNQLLNAYYWFYTEPTLQAAMREVIDYYFWGGWTVVRKARTLVTPTMA